MDNFLTTYFEPVSATTAAMAAPSILGGGMTGAGMMTAGAPIVPGKSYCQNVIYWHTAYISI